MIKSQKKKTSLGVCGDFPVAKGVRPSKYHWRAGEGGSERRWCVRRRGAVHGRMGAGEHVHVRLQLQGRAELRLPAFSRGTAALLGREGAAEREEAKDAVRFLHAGGMSLWALLCSYATLRG